MPSEGWSTLRERQRAPKEGGTNEKNAHAEVLGGIYVGRRASCTINHYRLVINDSGEALGREQHHVDRRGQPTD